MFCLLQIIQCAASQSTLCTARGRFPNNTNPDCRGYTMCLPGAGNATFTKYDLQCPEQTVYSHLESQCTNVTSYQCLPGYNCTQEGDYPDLSSTDCKSYISCFKDLNSTLAARLIDCPTHTVFSSLNKTCVNETLYKCNSVTENPIIFHVIVNNATNVNGSVLPSSAISVGAMCITVIGFTLSVMFF